MIMLVYSILLTFNAVKSQTTQDRLGHLCDRSKCSDKQVIQYDNVMNISLISKTYDIQIVVGQEWHQMSILTKQARWIYCAPKVTLPYVTDKDSSVEVKNLPIDSSEAALMDSGYCSITTKCITDDCWGDQSNICGNVDGSNKVPVGGYTIEMDCNNRNTFRGGCNQDFMCGRTEAKIRLFLAKLEGDIKPESFYYVIKAPGVDKSYSVSKDITFKNPDGSVSFVKAVKTPVSISQEKAHCYADSVETVCRIVSTSSVSPGETIRFVKGGVYSKANKIYFLRSNVEPMPVGFAEYSSSSIKDIASLFGVVEYAHMQSERNIMVLNNRVSYLGNAVINIIKSLGKVDDTLIGTIVGRASKTIWLSPDVFQQCSCTQQSAWDWDAIKSGLNPCERKTIPFQYVDGGYVKSTDSSSFMETWVSQNKDFSCSINDANVHNMTFAWEHTDFEYEHIYIPTMTGSSSDWDGWTKIIADDEKRNRDSADTHSKGESGGNDLNINPVFSLISFLSPYVPWTALCIAIYAAFK